MIREELFVFTYSALYLSGTARLKAAELSCGLFHDIDIGLGHCKTSGIEYRRRKGTNISSNDLLL